MGKGGQESTSIESSRLQADAAGMSPRGTSGNNRVGKMGEDAAALFLRACSYDILASNVRVGRRDEIDIIAFDRAEHVMVFVEVKTRAAATLFHPSVNVTQKKRSRMQKAARRWVAEQGYEGYWRMDIVCIVAGRIVGHYVNVGAWT